MPWNAKTAQGRINKLLEEVPDFDVQRFADYLPMYESRRIAAMARQEALSPPLFSLDRNKAVVVDTVQVYINITNYEDYRLEDGQETENTHARALSLLHLIYSAADRVIENTAAQRVDFHSGRVHAVVLESGSQGITKETLAEALAFIEDFRQVAELANHKLAKGEFQVKFRIGVDVGTCVAINNGTGYEQEPMFLGSAANHAAKLADGDQPGVYLSAHAKSLLGLPQPYLLSEYVGLSDPHISVNAARRNEVDQLVYGVQDRSQFAEELIANWQEEVRNGQFIDITNPDFRFCHKEPPLKDIDYVKLMPSASIRMPLVSLFADLSGYTDYVDRAIAVGGIGDAVRALYVIRQEFQNVVEKDFQGRKVRFIGDCIHALIAEGTCTETDKRKSVSSAALCAGGLHSSFELCKATLGGLEGMGLAVGLELGMTPVSRIGIRGERSVRVASSTATSISEKMQRECADTGIKFGPDSLRAGPVALEDLLNESGYQSSLTYDDIADCLSAPAATAAMPRYARAHLRCL